MFLKEITFFVQILNSAAPTGWQRAARTIFPVFSTELSTGSVSFSLERSY